MWMFLNLKGKQKNDKNKKNKLSLKHFFSVAHGTFFCTTAQNYLLYIQNSVFLYRNCREFVFYLKGKSVIGYMERIIPCNPC